MYLATIPSPRPEHNVEPIKLCATVQTISARPDGSSLFWRCCFFIAKGNRGKNGSDRSLVVRQRPRESSSDDAARRASDAALQVCGPFDYYRVINLVTDAQECPGKAGPRYISFHSIGCHLDKGIRKMPVLIFSHVDKENSMIDVHLLPVASRSLSTHNQQPEKGRV